MNYIPVIPKLFVLRQAMEALNSRVKVESTEDIIRAYEVYCLRIAKHN